MNFKKRTSRKSGGVNMSSTADISFLLLIFFLLTTIVFYDTGISVKLSPWSGTNYHYGCGIRQNAFRVVINSDNQLLVSDKQINVKNLKRIAKEFILNPNKRDDLAKSPKSAIISLQSDRRTNYETYFTAYNELRAAYYEIWDEAALKKFEFKYKHLDNKRQRAIKNEYPFVIVEAEPTNFLAKKSTHK
jgi:biopolymer transport protein ExbD